MTMCYMWQIGDQIYKNYIEFLWLLVTCETKEGNMLIHLKLYNDFQWHMGIYYGWKIVCMEKVSYDFKKLQKSLQLSSWDFVASCRHMTTSKWSKKS